MSADGSKSTHTYGHHHIIRHHEQHIPCQAHLRRLEEAKERDHRRARGPGDHDHAVDVGTSHQPVALLMTFDGRNSNPKKDKACVAHNIAIHSIYWTLSSGTSTAKIEHP